MSTFKSDRSQSRLLYYYALVCLGCICLLTTQANSAANTLGISNYQIDSGDRIQINVFDENELSLEVLLGDSGIVNYPFLGELKLTGLTLKQVESLITDGLKPDYLINPSVQVFIVEYRPFFIDGEVNNPGGYPYQPALSVSKAVALAGGFSERASKSSIYVIRATDKSQTKVKVSLNDPIYPGDVMSIEESFF